MHKFKIPIPLLGKAKAGDGKSDWFNSKQDSCRWTVDDSEMGFAFK
jgi:hypothetical protein